MQRKDRDSYPISSEDILFSRDEKISREYDRKFVENAKLSDLDLHLVQIIADNISRGMSPERCLQHLNLAEYDGFRLRLRKAALLLFANKIYEWYPRCQIRILKINGNEIFTGENYNIIEDVPIIDNILRIIDSSWELLRPHLTQTKFFKDATFRKQIIYPELACKEALINAIAHRDYSAEGTGIEVHIYHDRIEFISPGGLLSSIKLTDIKENKGVHESRNSLIARVLREAGYMRELGEGIRRIFQLMRLNELAAPEFVSDRANFKVILHHKFIYSEAEKIWLDNFTQFDLSREEKTIICLGYNDHQISPNEIWEHVGITDTDYYRQLVEQLRRKGILIRSIDRDAAYRKARNQGISKKAIPQFKIVVPSDRYQVKADEPLDELDYAKIFVGNIPYGTKESSLINLFNKFGEVVSVQIPTDCITGFQRGFAFIEYAKSEHAKKALESTKTLYLEDRELYINKYISK